MERRPHGAPASSPACAAPSALQEVSCRRRRRADRPLAGEDTGAPGGRWPVRTRRSMRTLAGESAGPMERRPHGAPAPWSAGPMERRPHGAPASSPACAAPSALQEVSCRRRLRADRPLAGEDTGAPGARWPVRTRRSMLARADVWSAGPMERRRPRRPAPHRRRRRSASIRRPYLATCRTRASLTRRLMEAVAGGRAPAASPRKTAGIRFGYLYRLRVSSCRTS